MFKWVIFVVMIIASSILSYLYVDLKNIEKTPELLPAVEVPNSVRIIHSFADGVHRYTGQIKLPHSCFSIRTEANYNVNTNNSVILSLTTKDNILEERFCSQITTRYPFETFVEAPQTAPLILRIDGIERPTKILETTWMNPTGTVVTK